MRSSVTRMLVVTTVVTLVAVGGLVLPIAAQEVCDPACVEDPNQNPPGVNHPNPDQWFPDPTEWIPDPDNWSPDPPKAHPQPDDWSPGQSEGIPQIDNWHPQPDQWAPGLDG